MRFISTLGAIVAAMLLLPAPAALASESDGYDVICITQTMPGVRPLPKVCVPVPVPLP